MTSRDLLSVTEAAKALGLSSSRVRLLCVQGRIRAVLVGRTYIITAEELRAFRKKPRRPGRPPQ